MLLPNSPVASTANAENPIPHSHVEVRGSGKTKNGNSISFKTVISLFFLAFSHHPNKPTTEYRLKKKNRKTNLVVLDSEGTASEPMDSLETSLTTRTQKKTKSGLGSWLNCCFLRQTGELDILFFIFLIVIIIIKFYIQSTIIISHCNFIIRFLSSCFD